jgi:hypothetical protein
MDRASQRPQCAATALPWPKAAASKTAGGSGLRRASETGMRHDRTLDLRQQADLQIEVYQSRPDETQSDLTPSTFSRLQRKSAARQLHRTWLLDDSRKNLFRRPGGARLRLHRCARGRDITPCPRSNARVFAVFRSPSHPSGSRPEILAFSLTQQRSETLSSSNRCPRPRPNQKVNAYNRPQPCGEVSHRSPDAVNHLVRVEAHPLNVPFAYSPWSKWWIGHENGMSISFRPHSSRWLEYVLGLKRRYGH